VEATNYCQAELAGSGASPAQVQRCIDAYLSGGAAAADAVVSQILDVLDGILGGSGGGGGDGCTGILCRDSA